MSEDIGAILTGWAKPKSNEERLSNESKIREFKSQDPLLFIYTMSEQLNNSDLDVSGRHLAGVLFK